MQNSASEPAIVQLVLQPNTAELTSTTEDVIHVLSRRVRPHHWVEISMISQQANPEILLSKQANRRTIQQVRSQLDANPQTPELEPIPSSDTAIVAAIQRFSDRVAETNGKHPIYFYLVTDGTSDPQAIAQLREISKTLAQYNLETAHLFVLGLNPKHRLSMAGGFAPIGDRVEFASNNYDEWVQLLRKF
ncbi:hypothetical protein [Lyngbya sp. PCC 8106]|uniref:hypothetical protein n=1 Tax=Lyngbya sp. (strain PCC 8106) TaxID=313612 RepID=UPI0000EAA1D7|nr:hypothetical protein [Lyngbya sp. PCC 8106]EAW33334.1 hypothetical protein L8106_03172 [Lyngbya sp. PCC 8106]